jgi:hypothetical protein
MPTQERHFLSLERITRGAFVIPATAFGRELFPVAKFDI